MTDNGIMLEDPIDEKIKIINPTNKEKFTEFYNYVKPLIEEIRRFIKKSNKDARCTKKERDKLLKGIESAISYSRKNNLNYPNVFAPHAKILVLGSYELFKLNKQFKKRP